MKNIFLRDMVSHRSPLGRYSGKDPGFTLVEMAIVLVIIGIILAGILNAQSMIESSRAKDYVGTIEDIRTAMTYFKQRYRYLPGDLPTPATDITVVPALVAGTGGTTGDGRIDGAIGLVTGLAIAGSEVAVAPWQLYHARFIDKINGGAGPPDTQRRLSTTYGAIHIASAATVNGLVAGFIAANPAAQNAIVFQNLTCEIVTEMDNKIDDGGLTTGRAMMAAPACVSGATVPWYAVVL
ncbi:MAG: prepilin-type N-terminal cleavage/methylation domain-containing protein [Sulfuritalea sp.]|nr:prepilin-type N-terminal cleavage/methylation domain-containing protein [Sulfuritalea sp.]